MPRKRKPNPMTDLAAPGPDEELASDWARVQAEMAAASKQHQVELREMRRLQRQINAALQDLEAREKALAAGWAAVHELVDKLRVDKLLIDSKMGAIADLLAQRRAEDGGG